MDTEDDFTLSFASTIVKECSTFFLSLHKFCIDYEKKIKNRITKNRLDLIKKVDKKKKIKKKKRKGNFYINFFKEKIKILKAKEKYKKYDGKMLTKIVSAKWKKLSFEDKKNLKNKYLEINKEKNKLESVEDNNKIEVNTNFSQNVVINENEVKKDDDFIQSVDEEESEDSVSESFSD